MSWWLGKKGPILVTQFLRLHTGPSPQLSQTRAGNMPTMNSEDTWIQGQGFPESHTPVRTSQGHWQATDWADHDLHGHFWPRPCGDSKLPLTHRDTGLWLFKYGDPPTLSCLVLSTHTRHICVLPKVSPVGCFFRPASFLL